MPPFFMEKNIQTEIQLARSDERYRISREMHDEMGFMYVRLNCMLSELEEKSGSGKDVLSNEIKKIRDWALELAQKIREISLWKTTVDLDKNGFAEQISDLIQKTFQGYEIQCETLFLLNSEIDLQLACSIFRLIQESLSNIIKHAKADKVTVSIRENDKKICLTVTDNGRGFLKSRVSRGSLGISGMKKRTEELCGKFEINTGRNRGTTVRIELPLS